MSAAVIVYVAVHDTVSVGARTVSDGPQENGAPPFTLSSVTVN
jgi:hypothetical protein